jgi:hypothetical protein
LSLKNLEPRVWDAGSPCYLPGLSAVMVSYADVHDRPAWRRRAMRDGMHAALGLPGHVRVYLDNGAFAFARAESAIDPKAYAAFVRATRPDWKPIPRDYIPLPDMSPQRQRGCFDRTMRTNREYRRDGYVPVIHAGKHLADYVRAVADDPHLSQKKRLAVGGLVPHLLRKPKARPYAETLAGLRSVRRTFHRQRLHLFGVGGTATLHLAALLGFDSADSSGWRNRAARGIVQLPGSSERLVAALGKWRGRAPSANEWGILEACPCPACRSGGLEALQATGQHGFRHRATHNLWVLLEELAWIEATLREGTYAESWEDRLDNSIYRPLIRSTLAEGRGGRGEGREKGDAS